MADKSARPNMVPKGASYCETPGTSCYYNAKDVCVNCARPKGWRNHTHHRARLRAIKGLR